MNIPYNTIYIYIIYTYVRYIYIYNKILIAIDWCFLVYDDSLGAQICAELEMRRPGPPDPVKRGLMEWTAPGLFQHDANDGDTNHGETHVEVWAITAITNKEYLCSKILLHNMWTYYSPIMEHGDPTIYSTNLSKHGGLTRSWQFEWYGCWSTIGLKQLGHLVFRQKIVETIWVCLKIVYPYTQWLMIIIPTKWL